MSNYPLSFFDLNSTATLKMFLEGCGTKVFSFIPDREDGYGPNAQKMVEYKEKGCTVFLTTHNMEEASVLCDELALLNEGKAANIAMYPHVLLFPALLITLLMISFNA